MTIDLLKGVAPVCFGIACNQHGRCERYVAIDHSAGTADAIGTCMTYEGYPMFIERASAGVASLRGIVGDDLEGVQRAWAVAA